MDNKKAPLNDELAKRWREIQGENHWKGLLEPTADVELRRNVIRYGEFNQAIYDAWDSDAHSKYVGSSKYRKEDLFRKVGLESDDRPDWGYEVSRYLYATATSHILGRFFLSSRSKEAWSKESNWIGMVAVATDDATKWLGRRDIVVVWRGTLRLFEWIDDFHAQKSDADDFLPAFGQDKVKQEEEDHEQQKHWYNVLQKMAGGKREELFQFEKRDASELIGISPENGTGNGGGNDGVKDAGGCRGVLGNLMQRFRRRSGADTPQIEKGWLLIYTSTDEKSPYTKTSARDQILNELQYLLKKYDSEDVSITVVGHSLGASLAVLNVYDITENRVNVRRRLDPSSGEEVDDVVPVTAVVFGCPLVGDAAFKQRCEELGEEAGLRVLRVKNKRDMIALYPPTFMGYREVGEELLVDHRSSTFLKDSRTIGDWHNLEAHLHLVAGYQGPDRPFDLVVERDPALVNKSCEFLKPELNIPGLWWQEQFKGLRRHPVTGRFYLPDRDPLDVPQPEPMREL